MAGSVAKMDPLYDMREPKVKPKGWQILFGIGFAGLLFAAFLAELLVNYEIRKMAGLFIILFWMPLMVVHEIFHGLAARAVGWRVGVIVLGYGPLIKIFPVAGTWVELRMFPISGFVQTAPRASRYANLKDAFIYFAGPAADILAAVLVWVILGTQTLFSVSNDLGILAAQSFAAAGALGAVLNLLPIGTVLMNGQVIPNDGLGIWLALWRSPTAYQDAPDLRYDPEKEEWYEHDPADDWKRQQ